MVSCFAFTDVATLARLRSDPSEIHEFIYPNDGESEPPNYIDLDKSWHCIHFMLTGSATGGPEPLSLAIMGGEEVGEDVGYGPVRLLNPQSVTGIASALAAIDEAEFRSRFDPHAMQKAKVYLSDMCVRDGNDALDYVVQNYLGLATAYAAASDRGDGALIWLC